MADESVDRVRRRLAAGLAAAPLASLAACQALPTGAVPVAPPAAAGAAPQVRAGDRWRYLEVNGYSGEARTEIDCTVAQAAPNLRVRVADASGRPRSDEVYEAPWRVAIEPFYDLVQLFETPLALLPEPPAAGASRWVSARYRVEGTQGWLDWQEQREAVRWERVRVPAGEFDALRIERRIHFVHADPRRSQSVRTEQLWYAPAVNRWVRREWTGQYIGWPIRRGGPSREDWVVHLLAEYAPARG